MSSETADRAHNSHDHELLERSRMTGVPDTFGGYRLQESLGRGGDAPLYRATDSSNRPVIIRLFPEHNDERQRRFIREALPAIRLRHPHIVATLELGGDPGRPFAVMEHFAGRTLAELIREGIPLPVPRALGLIEQLCSAVAFARAQKLLRRELRPDDVMVAGDGVLKIVDYGISRPLEPTVPAADEFVAPEQARGLPADARSDVYTVGALLFSLVGWRKHYGPGGLPGRGRPGREPADTSLPGIDAGILRIVNRCMEPEPDRRYPDAEALARELRRVSVRLHDGAQDEPVAEPAAFDAADLDPEHTLAVIPSDAAPRRTVDRDEIARRRAGQIALHLEAAALAIDAHDFESGIAACEEALVLDPDNAIALARIELARAALDSRQSAVLLQQADDELANHQPAAALALIDLAAASGAAPDEVRRRRDRGERALRDRELGMRHESALHDQLDRAHRQFERGELHDAIATLEDLHIIAVVGDPADEAHRADADALRACISDALAVEARELRRQFVAAELLRVRAEIDRDEYRQALDRLAGLEREEDWSAEMTELRIVAEEGLAESEVLAAKARMLTGHVAAAASLFAQNDLHGSLGRVQAALALAPGHEPALALRGMIENRVLELAEQQRAVERQARQIAARPPAPPPRAREETFAREQGPGDDVVGTDGDTVIVLPAMRPIQVRFAGADDGPDAFLSEDGGLAGTAAAPPVARLSPGSGPLDLPLRNTSAAGDVEVLLRGATPAPPDGPTIVDFTSADVPRTARPRSLALYGSVGFLAVAAIAFVAWIVAGRPPAAAPELPPAVESSAAPAGPARPGPEPAPLVPTPQIQAAAPPTPQTRTPAVAPPSPPLSPQLPAATATAVPPAAAARTAEPPPAAREADVTLARRLEGLRDTARRQFGRGEGQQALTTVAAGLDLAPADPVLRQMLDATLSEARDDAAQSRSGALAVAGSVANTSTYREADLRARDAARSAQNGAVVEAVRGFWMAVALFTRAASEAQLQVGLPAAPPAAPVVAAREPEEPKNAGAPPAAPAAVSPAPVGRGTARGGAGGEPAVPRPTPPSDEPAIRATLRSYAAAYSALDAPAVRRVFPSVNEQALRRAFGGLRSQEVAIEGEQVSVTGETATVSCTLVTLAVGQVGAATPRRDSRRVTFVMARREDAWVIVDRR